MPEISAGIIAGASRPFYFPPHENAAPPLLLPPPRGARLLFLMLSLAVNRKCAAVVAVCLECTETLQLALERAREPIYVRCEQAPSENPALVWDESGILRGFVFSPAQEPSGSC